MAKREVENSQAPYRQVADAIRASITNGTYGPGEKLPTGKDLADEYGVAINTARSALEILRQEGLIAVRHGQGSYVLSQPESGGADAENADVPSVAAVHQQLAEINRRLAAIEERLNELAR